jgi:hypothetical protein
VRLNILIFKLISIRAQIEKKETNERLGEREKVQLRRIHDKMARLRKTSVRNESNRYWKLFHADKVVIAHELKLSITIRHWRYERDITSKSKPTLCEINSTKGERKSKWRLWRWNLFFSTPFSCWLWVEVEKSRGLWNSPTMDSTFSMSVLARQRVL